MNQKQIQLSLYNLSFICHNNRLEYPLCITAKRSKNILRLLTFTNQIYSFSLQHLFYLCSELYKAEIAYMIGQNYIQE